MSLTRKHFIELARIVHEEKLPECLRKSIAEKLADFCAEHNPNFDREKFLKACEIREDAS